MLISILILKLEIGLGQERLIEKYMLLHNFSHSLSLSPLPSTSTSADWQMVCRIYMLVEKMDRALFYWDFRLLLKSG